MASTATRTESTEFARTVLSSTGSGRLLRLFLLDLDRGPAVVIAADRTGMMGLFGLVTMGARLESRYGDGEVGASITLPRVRDSPLGDSHLIDFSLSLRRVARGLSR